MTTAERGADLRAGPTVATGATATSTTAGVSGPRRALACVLVFGASLALTAATAGDMGVTWDEPAYRFSQLRSQLWWERLGQARSPADIQALVEPDALLYYWTYARHGVNFHPPLAGQLNLLTHAVFGRWVRDVPSRRLSSCFEVSAAVALLFGFLSRRYGWVAGVVAAGSLLMMPRVFGESHVAGTDTPGLLLWPLTAVAFWNGLNPGGRRWRVLVGVLLGLAFVEKMGAVVVLVPLLVWLRLSRPPLGVFRRGAGADWVDGVLTVSAMLAPLGLAFAEILRLTRSFPEPSYTDLFVERPLSYLPGAILLGPLAVWVVRRILGRVFRRSPVWGAERPALETLTAVLAFAPVVGWLGNPAWWRETLPRLSHYYMLNTMRRGALPDIRIFYRGHVYEYSLPWENAWLLTGLTVPLATLAFAILGLVFTFRTFRRDKLPAYFLLHLSTLPMVRMLTTPAHDGVRLFLPTFFFLAAMAGWGASSASRLLADRLGARASGWPGLAVALLALAGPAWSLAGVHPYELSYFNAVAGGPRGAWERRGMELSYWYDAFTPRVLDDLNRKFPGGAQVDFRNDLTLPMTFIELQSLGHVRPDIVLGWMDPDRFPFVWLLAQDSKSTPLTRLLFQMTPWYASRPRQLGGVRVASVVDPVAVSRAYALAGLAGASEDRPVPEPEAPGWVSAYVPALGRLWGVGQKETKRASIAEPAFAWAEADPAGFLDAARALARRGDKTDDPGAKRLLGLIRDNEANRGNWLSHVVLRARPGAFAEAAAMLVAHPEAVREAVTRASYVDPEALGGYLDRDLKPGGNSPP